MSKRLRESTARWLPLLLAAVLIAPFLRDAYARVAAPAYFRFLTSPPWMTWLHLGSSGFALLVGWLNLLAVRAHLGSAAAARPGAWHRWLGRLYCLGVAFGIAGGVALLPHVAHGGAAARFGLSYGLALWTGCTAAMLLTARQRRYEQHRRWALRSYAISFSGITLRFILETGLALKLPLTPVYATATCSCFLINLLVVEWLWVRAGSGPVEVGALQKVPDVLDEER